MASGWLGLLVIESITRQAGGVAAFAAGVIPRLATAIDASPAPSMAVMPATFFVRFMTASFLHVPFPGFATKDGAPPGSVARSHPLLPASPG